jgi:hypothetical protein
MARGDADDEDAIRVFNRSSNHLKNEKQKFSAGARR